MSAGAHEQQRRKRVVQRDGQPSDAREGPQPAAQEQRDGYRGDHENVGVLGQEVERPAEAAVLGVEAGHQLGFGFRQVEGRAVGLGRGGDDVDREGHDHEAVVGEDEPDAALGLRLDDALHAERAGHHHARKQRERQRHFVAHQLRRAAQRAQQRIVAVGRPAAQDDAQDSHRRGGGDHQQPHVHVRYVEDPRKGQHRKGRQGGDGGNAGGEPEQGLVGVRGDDVFLEQQLQRVGDGLQQPVRPHAHGAQAHLEIRQDLALDQREISGHQRKSRDNHQGHHNRHEQGMGEDGVHIVLTATPKFAPAAGTARDTGRSPASARPSLPPPAAARSWRPGAPSR